MLSLTCEYSLMLQAITSQSVDWRFVHLNIFWKILFTFTNVQIGFTTINLKLSRPDVSCGILIVKTKKKKKLQFIETILNSLQDCLDYEENFQSNINIVRTLWSPAWTCDRNTNLKIIVLPKLEWVKQYFQSNKSMTRPVLNQTRTRVFAYTHETFWLFQHHKDTGLWFWWSQFDTKLHRAPLVTWKRRSVVMLYYIVPTR